MQSPKDIRLILFDIGDVLVKYDSTQLCVNLNQYSKLPNHNFLKIYEYLFKFGTFNRLELGGMSIDDMYVNLKCRFNLCCDCYDFITAWTKELRVDDNMKRLVSLLSKKFEVGVLSNIDSVRYRHMVRNDMIDTDKLSYIFLSYKMGMVKPDIRIADYVSAYTELHKPQILFVDDKEMNVKAMQAGGICSIQYSNHKKLLSDLKEMGIEL